MTSRQDMLKALLDASNALMLANDRAHDFGRDDIAEVLRGCADRVFGSIRSLTVAAQTEGRVS